MSSLIVSRTWFRAFTARSWHHPTSLTMGHVSWPNHLGSSKPSGLSQPQPQSNLGGRSVSQHGQALEPDTFPKVSQEGLELTGPGALLRRALSGTSLALDHAMQDSAVNDVEPRFSDQCHASGGLVQDRWKLNQDSRYAGVFACSFR